VHKSALPHSLVGEIEGQRKQAGGLKLERNKGVKEVHKKCTSTWLEGEIEGQRRQAGGL
jgi:hypothetical protein